MTTGPQVALACKSPVQITSEPRGDNLPPLPHSIPHVRHRVGIDLTPIDVTDRDATRWLRALIWPEHIERAQRLEAALGVARRSPPWLVSGDLADALPTVLEDVPDDATLCIFHSYTLNHCSNETRERFDEILAAVAHERDLYRISLEYHVSNEHPRLTLFTYHQSVLSEEHLAFCESYGRWIEWLQPADNA